MRRSVVFLFGTLGKGLGPWDLGREIKGKSLLLLIDRIRGLVFWWWWMWTGRTEGDKTGNKEVEVLQVVEDVLIKAGER